jgi:Fe-S-cluster containining protein
MVPYAEALLIVAHHFPTVLEVTPELERQEMLAARLGAVDMASATGEDFLFAWWKSRTPCAFLHPVTKECRVYEHRPTACRGHGVIDQPPELCAIRADSLAHGQTLPIVNEIPHGKAFEMSMMAAYAATVETVGGAVMGLLHTMVNQAVIAVRRHG